MTLVNTTKKKLWTKRLERSAPADLGLPEQYGEWRRGQAGAVADVLCSDKPFLLLSMPPGGGKSLVYTAAGVVGGLRTSVLVCTKGLQDQNVGNFAGIGMTDIRGSANYQCVDRKGLTCEEASDICRAGEMCEKRVAYRKACEADMICTNYQAWLHTRKAAGKAAYTLTKKGKAMPGVGKGAVTDADLVNPFKLLVMDEAHQAESELSGFLAMTFGIEEMEKAAGKDRVKGTDWEAAKWTQERWRIWAAETGSGVAETVNGLGSDLKGLKERAKLMRVYRKLEELAELKDDWVMSPEKRKGNTIGVRFDPVWPGMYGPRLWGGHDKSVLVSGTARPKTLGLLGIRNELCEVLEYPYQFPKENNVIWYWPLAQVTYQSTEQQMQTWMAGIDRLIEDRAVKLGRKGIIHVPSFHLQEYIVNRSRFRELLYWNRSGGWGEEGVTRTVEKFKKARKGVFISPSVGTGWDFPGDECRWQVIGKLPKPDSRSRIMRERSKRDRSYVPYITMQTVTQWAYRGMRSEKDWCETIIVDGMWQQFWDAWKVFAVPYFEYRRTMSMPPAIRAAA